MGKLVNPQSQAAIERTKGDELVELNFFIAIGVLISLVLLWVVVKNPGPRTLQSDYQDGYPANPSPPMNNGQYDGYQAPQQTGGCMQVLAVIGFLAICLACVVLGMALAGNLAF